MKSMTIHGVDESLAKLIQAKARSEGLSINKTIKKLLEESLGVRPSYRDKNRRNFEEFCGMWSDSEYKEFKERTADLRGYSQKWR